MESNTQLNTRFGAGGQNPSKEEMVAAIREIFIEDNPNCTESDYAEHPETFLSYGHDNPGEDEYIWTEYTVSIYRDKTGKFTKYRDQDDDEPEFEYSITGLSQDTAIGLWSMLADGKVGEVEKIFKETS